MHTRLVLIMCAFVALVAPAFAQPEEDRLHEMRGADFVFPITCTETHVTAMTDRFGKQIVGDNGLVMSFASGVKLISYETDKVAIHERIGDKVQLCFLGRIEGTPGCLPAADKRGLWYRVYDYRLHAAYIMMNSQHVCGGA